MPPKKAAEPEKRALIGRVGTNLRIGIVGLPNVGKSTFFNVLTKSQAHAENFPFCTIDPNENNALFRYVRTLLTSTLFQARRVPVPDARYDFLVEHYKPASKVPAFLNVTDIAGLVKGASEGQGLGNAFLSHIKACDALFHLCRAFDDDDVTHVEGEVNPVRDLDIINEELRLKDESYLLPYIEKFEKTTLRSDKKAKPEYDILLKIKSVLCDEKKHLRFQDWNAHEIEVLNKHLFLTTKPVIYLVNLSEKDFIRKKNKWLVKIKEAVEKSDPGALIVPFSAAFELQVVDMSKEEKKAYEEEHKATSQLEKIIVAGYKALNLQYFFTCGPDEVKAWTIQAGTKAPQAAGRIHTDFEKGFIMAEVMKYADFHELGSEAAVKVRELLIDEWGSGVTVDFVNMGNRAAESES
ncbi:Obg-like ATPase 1 [Amphibalanus amphitrite]|uniref:Obg-like ATPase 1 n=1 Tax=Amphibalanus amphitrite TaxID=1232801 RepID=A0A6A4V4R3_AMPAM|nr:Obg-like ATPase 1 [Amphibalanus amphitrite]